jgi:F-type H+-transporting ATPase subunit epsilon
MMHFRLVSAQGIRYDDEAYEVLVPTKGGTIAVFENHMPLISAALGGVVSVRAKSSDSDAAMKHFAVGGGVMQVSGKDLIFLSDDITTPEDVNEKEAEAALARAEELIKNASSRTQINEAHRLLHHSRAQLNVAHLKRRHHS